MPTLPNAFSGRMSPPEARWRFGKKPGGPDHEDGGSGRKMTLRIARWPSGKKDKDPGTLDERPGKKKNRRETRKRRIQAKWASGKPKNRPGNQDRRPDDEIPGRDGKTSPGCGEFAPGAGSLTTESKGKPGT